jgi:uncharacterized membrane protein
MIAGVPTEDARAAQTSPRLESVDLLRGLVMALMALDHTRDFFHNAIYQNVDPLNEGTGSIALFFTRWITHYCAPVFLFLAGTGAFLSSTRGKSKGELSRFLVTRGLWLVFLELTFIRWAGWSFAINLREHWGIVIWAIGWSMVALAGLIHLPLRGIAAFGIGMIALHNAFDGIKPEALGALGWLWRVLHAGGSFELPGGVVFGAGYPLIPWIGVMALGYCFGAVMLRPPEERQRWLLRVGLNLTVVFFLLRFTNLYGDAQLWTSQPTGFRTVLSMLDCTKYPPSLCYLLMTLGPAAIALALLDRFRLVFLQPLAVFGRVPLFYYLLHLPLIHGLAVAVNLIRFDRADWLYGVTPAKPPADAGFDLVWVYFAWFAVLLILFPACQWFADLKRRRRERWLSYL